MKLLILLSLVALVVAEETHSSKYDVQLDIEALVNDDNQLNALSGCYLDTSPCNEVLASYKKIFAEIVKQTCAKCNPEQKHYIRRYIEALQQKSPQVLEDLKKKYDPENKLFAILVKAVANA